MHVCLVTIWWQGGKIGAGSIPSNTDLLCREASKLPGPGQYRCCNSIAWRPDSCACVLLKCLLALCTRSPVHCAGVHMQARRIDTAQHGKLKTLCFVQHCGCLCVECVASEGFISSDMAQTRMCTPFGGSTFIVNHAIVRSCDRAVLRSCDRAVMRTGDLGFLVHIESIRSSESLIHSHQPSCACFCNQVPVCYLDIW